MAGREEEREKWEGGLRRGRQGGRRRGSGRSEGKADSLAVHFAEQ